MGSNRPARKIGPSTRKPGTVASRDPLDEELVQVYLRPGEFHFARSPAHVATVLGSCVSITMYCRRLGAGAICHAILPKGSSEEGNEAFCYVDSAIRRMAGWFDRLGIRRSEIEVKFFGGADVLKQTPRGASVVTVGLSNIQMAMKTIEEENLRLLVSDVGGTMGRKLYFSTRTGDVLVKRLRRMPEGATP
ncbi:MAG: chemotaxis protein CheD [Deltaproteobacteria bacterium]|nr:chemotaxis protein CheD [Deltaproteobacteria bacterium]